MQLLCDAIYPLPEECDKTYGFFHFLGHIKEKRKILFSSEMHQKRKISFMLRLYVFWSQHKITFCENYFHCRYAMLRVYYVVCADVKILNVNYTKLLWHATTTVGELHIWAQTCSLKPLIVKLLRTFQRITHVQSTLKVV